MTQWIINLDFSVLYFIQENLRCEFLDSFCAFLSVAFDGGIGWFLLAIAMAFPKKTRTPAVSLVFSVLLTFLIGELVLKNLIGRERPCVVDQSVELAINFPRTFSFPSGHTGSSFAAAAGIFFFNKKLGIPALFLAALVGLSRIYLFVHYPTDVLGGALLGILSAYAVYRVMRHFCAETKIQSLFAKH